MRLERVREAVAAKGLAFRGAFHPDQDEPLVGGEYQTLVLLGFVGSDQWSDFAASPEANDSAPDALDRWSQRVIGALAEELGAHAIFPFGGPPWAPFIRWAQKSEPVYPSPVGMLIHPDWGLWHAWRGALAFREEIELPPRDERLSPCDSCAERRCLAACPVGAFEGNGAYDVEACATHISAPAGAGCMSLGCRARRACPVGGRHRYGAQQARFHMDAFLKAPWAATPDAPSTP